LLKIIHTSDWFLGQILHGHSREFEHARFLEWLTELLVERGIDVLIVAGNLFASPNPPISARKMLSGFLAELNRRLPTCRVILIGGRCDPGVGMDASREVLQAKNVYVAGDLLLADDGSPDFDRMIIPLNDTQGQTEAWCLPIPFAAVFSTEPGGGLRKTVRGFLDTVVHRRTEGQAVIMVCHCLVTDSRASVRSDKTLAMEMLDAVPHLLFPDSVTYVALGGLHLAQVIGKRETVRYCGSPLPLAVNEDHFPHQVIQVGIEDGQCRQIGSVRVPRTRAFLRVPPEGTVPGSEVLVPLAGLKEIPQRPPEEQPLLEVRVRLDEPQPSLRGQIEQALADCPVRLAGITVEYPRNSFQSWDDSRDLLTEITPERLFREFCRRRLHREPPPELLTAFRDSESRFQTQGKP
jgi:exonuclease SbcD